MKEQFLRPLVNTVAYSSQTGCLLQTLLKPLVTFSVHKKFSQIDYLLPEVVELCLDNDVTASCSCSLTCQSTFCYAGPMCQFINQCYSNPCHGAAACTTDPFGRYVCHCPKGWTGKNCSTDIDDCTISSLSPCNHGGTCVNTPGSFVCQCVPGYTGNILSYNVPHAGL